MLRIIWRAGCLETCTSGSGLGSGGSSWAYTTCVLPLEMRIRLSETVSRNYAVAGARTCSQWPAS